MLHLLVLLQLRHRRSDSPMPILALGLFYFRFACWRDCVHTFIYDCVCACDHPSIVHSFDRVLVFVSVYSGVCSVPHALTLAGARPKQASLLTLFGSLRRPRWSSPAPVLDRSHRPFHSSAAPDLRRSDPRCSVTSVFGHSVLGCSSPRPLNVLGSFGPWPLQSSAAAVLGCSNPRPLRSSAPSIALTIAPVLSCSARGNKLLWPSVT